MHPPIVLARAPGLLLGARTAVPSWSSGNQIPVDRAPSSDLVLDRATGTPLPARSDLLGTCTFDFLAFTVPALDGTCTSHRTATTQFQTSPLRSPTHTFAEVGVRLEAPEANAKTIRDLSRATRISNPVTSSFAKGECSCDFTSGMGSAPGRYPDPVDISRRGAAVAAPACCPAELTGDSNRIQEADQHGAVGQAQYSLVLPGLFA